MNPLSTVPALGSAFVSDQACSSNAMETSRVPSQPHDMSEKVDACQRKGVRTEAVVVLHLWVAIHSLDSTCRSRWKVWFGYSGEARSW